MSCHVCSRPPNSRLSFYCPTCARNQVYQLRYDYASVLLEKNSVGDRIEKSIAKNLRDTADIITQDGVVANQHTGTESKLDPTRLSIQTLRTGASQSTGRAQEISSHIATLEREIQEAKEKISQRRVALARRRSDAESANYELSNRRASALGIVQNNIKNTDKLWNGLHHKTVESRMFLCREAANLFGLRQRTRRRNRELANSFSIGGVNIVDLRDMNSANPAQINTSLAQIARLLNLVSHYLTLRPPAEIIIPHRGHPLPTIFTLSASYKPHQVGTPNLSPIHSIAGQSSSQPLGTKSFPRARPLFLDRSLPKLAKEDPSGYGLFIEAVALLAWDVTWLCRTQGHHLGSESWEDACDIGRNLWQLLVAPPALIKALYGRDNQPIQTPGKETANGNINNTQNNNNNTIVNNNTNNIVRPRSTPSLGHYSHGSAHSFLGSAEGIEFMKSWKMPSPVKIADKLKSTLLGEMANAEWELLGEEEWEDEAATNAIPGNIVNTTGATGPTVAK
ncbi:hypothetical protein FQN57_005768 [Myotisia sp. PD_48]|nr:hypothetical protein FQN57_005768 [Myotisia sp. PD_48]